MGRLADLIEGRYFCILGSEFTAHPAVTGTGADAEGESKWKKNQCLKPGE